MNRALALVLLVVGLLAFYSWQWAPSQHSGTVFALATHAYAAVLLLVLALVLRDPVLWAVLLLLMACSLLVVGCNTAYLIEPWPVADGDDICSAKLNVPVGTIGLALFLGLTGGVYMAKKKEDRDGP